MSCARYHMPYGIYTVYISLARARTVSVTVSVTVTGICTVNLYLENLSVEEEGV